MYNPNSPEVKLGEWAQDNADEYLKMVGKAIVDAHLSGGGKAALLKSKHGAVPVMDTIAVGDGEVWFVDAKGKTNSTFTRMTWTEQHGIDSRLWKSYITQKNAAGVDAFIILSEKKREVAPKQFEESNELLVYRLDENIKGFRRINKTVATYGKNGMVYWDRDAYIEKRKIE